jgi:hypothetical protein
MREGDPADQSLAGGVPVILSSGYTEAELSRLFAPPGIAGFL